MDILVFDTETTGIPIWKIPSESEEQPHIVELAAALVNTKTREITQSMNVLVKPEGWEIPEETIKIHGIANEKAAEEGVSEKIALAQFLSLYSECDVRVAHNTTFDNRIIRIALKRYKPDFIPDEIWKDRDSYYCTLLNFKKLVGGKDGHTLADAYKYFTHEEFEGGHRAMNDVLGCLEVFWGLQNTKQAIK